MKKLLSLLPLLGLFLAPLCQGALILEETPTASQPANIPDSIGRAGMAAAPAMDGDKAVILAVGGANFPNGMPWEGGKKVFYKDILKYKDGTWSKIGELPEENAYASYAAAPKGIIVAGGCNAETHSNKVWLIEADGKVSALPSLPQSVAYASCAVINNRLYIMGGQEDIDSTKASRNVYLLDLSTATPSDPNKAVWEILSETPIPGEGRILAISGATDGHVFLMGGCSLTPDENGKAQRRYHQDVLSLDPSKETWSTLKVTLPTPLAAAANPAPAREGKLLIIGGDDGSRVKHDPKTHPGQSNKLLLFDSKTQSFSEGGQWRTPLATAPALIIDKQAYTVSGETAPGVRSPAVSSINLKYSIEMFTLDWMVLGLGLSLILVLIVQIKRRGMQNIAVVASPTARVENYAWVVVALLWVVAALNYFDRQLLTTIREPIVRDIPQTEAQFGLLTAVFLFIYASLSPIGGFLADRFSRRVVILVSLIIWSGVTWWTGHVEDYRQLFIARALMGISEACYIPAALALITDYHRGTTRSIATGIHMSGIYTGMAVAGFGGSLAQAEGWRLTFGIFGFVGVAYALILIIFLRDPKPKDEGLSAQEIEQTPQLPKASIGAAVKNLFTTKAFWLLLGVVIGSGAANWLVLAWFPTLLKEKYNLGLGDAGIHATLWNSLAKYVAVIGGAILADQWFRHNIRARQLLPGIVFCVAAPLIFCSIFVGNFNYEWITGFGVFVGLIAAQGLAQGTLDATLMPVLRSHIDERFSATGYGFLNLASAGVGGLTVYYSGQLRDLGIPLTTAFAASSVLILICGLCLIFTPKPSPKS